MAPVKRQPSVDGAAVFLCLLAAGCGSLTAALLYIAGGALLLFLLLLTLLYKGYTAVRYFYVGCNLIAIIEECYLLTCLDWAASPKGSLILFLSLTVFFILLQSATCVMLLFSKSVKKFLYSQRNG